MQQINILNRLVHSFLMFFLLTGVVYAQPAHWHEVAPGVWKGIVGNPEKSDLLTAANPVAQTEALRTLPEQELPRQPRQMAADLQDGSVYLRFPLEREEQLYGFGLHFKTIHQRGRILTLHMDHYGGKDDGRTHAPVPFFVSDNGYGVFINSARYLKVWSGTAVRKDS